MGKKARLRKEQQIEQQKIEKAVIAQRLKSKQAPIIRFAVRLTAATLVTIVILYLGSIVNSHLTAQIKRVTAQGS